MPPDINKYVSNTDRDIYTVSNLPEEVIAVIFAYVSRSPKSFRDNISTVIEEEQHGRERAIKFHEKWVLHYGHASVAEHASVHVGVERVSRLFSSLLELTNEFLSFTEYSQRYQKPQRGDFFIPPELDGRPALKSEYARLNDSLYEAYSELNEGLFEWLKKESPAPEGREEKTHFRALEKLAFEDARYALGLGTFTNLGMTGNARALENALSKLLSSPYPEARLRAEEIKDEVSFSVPTLVKYANPSPYIVETAKELTSMCQDITKQEHGKNSTGVTLLDWTGARSDTPETEALEVIVSSVIFSYSNLSHREVSELLGDKDPGHLTAVFKQSIEKMGKFDNPAEALRLVNYRAEFVVSEACWHQLLRHRKVKWITQEPTVIHGYLTPPSIVSSGLEEVLARAVKNSEELYGKLMNESLHTVASYVVTNAHLRRVMGSFDLWELYHLINLRTSEGAQWDIKNVITTLAEEVSRYHPNLLKPALKRVRGE